MSADFPPVEFEAFHRSELPELIAGGRGALALPGARGLGGLAIRHAESGACWSYLPGHGGLRAAPGDADAATVVELSQAAWQGLVHDLETPASLLYHGRVGRVRGDLMRFVGWEAALRALYTGRPVYDPADLDLRDRHGAPLDPTRGFRLDDDARDLAHFLREVGYLLVRGAFSREELADFRAAADELRRRARPGDQKSWWGRDDRGEAVLCRVLEAGLMPALRGLPDDPRIRKAVDLADTPLVPKAAEELDGVTVLWKNPHMREGLSDLPWHRDCGMGGHASMCPTLVCSVFLEANTPEAGALRFLPGSWQASYRFADAQDADALPGVVVPARPGDFTLHYGDGWHAAPPPTSAEGPFRSCVLLSFAREGAYNHRGERHYNDVLLGSEDGQVAHMREVARRY